eukprot:5763325-Amphidinium_carterae.1
MANGKGPQEVTNEGHMLNLDQHKTCFREIMTGQCCVPCPMSLVQLRLKHLDQCKLAPLPHAEAM